MDSRNEAGPSTPKKAKLDSDGTGVYETKVRYSYHPRYNHAAHLHFGLSDQILYKVAEKLGKDWVRLAYRLGFDKTDVDGIEFKLKDVERQGHEMLVRWKRAQSSCAEEQFVTLYCALKDLGRADIATFMYAPAFRHYGHYVAGILFTDWIRVAPVLDIPDEQIKTIEGKHKGDATSQALEMLQLWEEAQPNDVEQQVDTLCTALREIGREDIEKFVKEHIALPRVMNKVIIDRHCTCRIHPGQRDV